MGPLNYSEQKGLLDRTIDGLGSNVLKTDIGVSVLTPIVPVSSLDYVASKIAKAAAGNLYGITGYNSGPDQWIQVHDSATLPANAAIPKIIFKVDAESNFFFAPPGGSPYPFATGIVICNSTTGKTKTIGAADCWFNILIK